MWDSQFGRFVNNGPIVKVKSGDPFFYLHTLLWAFAPWCLLFYYAVYGSIKKIWLKSKLAEYYTLSGGLSLLLLFSLSRFQLPFYANTIFPFFAIITAPFCHEQLTRFGTAFRFASLWLYTTVFVVAVLLINYFSRPGSTVLLVASGAVFALIACIIWIKIDKNYLKAFFITCLAALFANFYLNTVFYNVIASYNGQIKAADYINQSSFNGSHIYSLKFENNIFQFYSKRPIDYVPLDNFKEFKPRQPSVFFASYKTIDFLQQNHAEFKVIKAFQNYPQEIIFPAFINKATRSTVLDSVYLISK